MRLSAFVALSIAAGLAAPAVAQPDPRPVARATAVQQPPVLDGDVLDDPAWQPATLLTDFRQTTPDEGRPASERTEVRILYTRDTLFVGVVCHDREPGRVITSHSRRDASLDDTDSFQVILDTFHDRQNGFLFGTNPAGVEYDAQVTSEGAGADDDSLAGFNLNWDASWQVRTRTGAFGWSAEFAIPFSTLRYGRGTPQTWGINFQRNIRRRNERSFWAPLTRQHGLVRLSSAGTLEGLAPPAQRNLTLTPYALAQASRVHGAGRGTDGDADVGADLKYSVTPSLTLDATVNTDFAQVEADEEQINLDRFDLFYPEKRPFFLENAGFFAVGAPGDVEMFFSRRIGIEAGRAVPILGGARLSGKLAGFNVGLLDMQTRAVEGVAPATNFAVARVYRELPNRSAIGAIVVNRDPATGGSGSNRTLALDGRWGIARHLDLTAFVARTFTPGPDEHPNAWRARATWTSPGWMIFGGYTEVGEDFRPQGGFVQRRGYRRPEALVFRTLRFGNNRFGLLEARPHVSYSGYWKPDGFHESGQVHIDNHLEWRGGWQFHTGVNLRHEGLRVPFEIYPGIFVPAGSYDFKEVQLVGETDESRPLSFDGRLTAGGFFDGNRVAISPGLRGRVGDTLNVSLSWQRNDIRLSAGRFVTNLVRTRVSYSFSPRLYLQGLLQYNDRIDNWSTNLRLGWLQRANTGLFLVVNENRETLGAWSPRDRSVTLKFSRSIDLLD